ncbi:zinc-alpha-2-glycoprotein-like [Erpetoichthys calabaricus]|uniref:zinc-alpha-2-glycoprotein-like n=1 Tax=Erpetoichthys calabaricus TaxID=27687 RepID=UPI00109FE10D|nr:zinc-alpha-2-glycoprotein-like [Erpetoichthys calabaricus]
MFWLKVLGIMCGLQISFAARLSVSTFKESMPKETVQLTCKADGFYPKAIDIQWYKGEAEPVPAKSGKLLLNDDNTYKFSKAVNVSRRDYEKPSYYCHVNHASLPTELIVPLN